jgi:ribosomal protein L3 glutamine methyltransferase
VAARKRAAAVPASVGALVRRGERLFTQARLAFGHGLTLARDEAAYLTLHTLKLPLDNLPLAKKVSASNAARVLELFERRIRERKPAAYLTREAWLGDQRFYVDERVIVPRSYIAELLFDENMPYLPPAAAVRRALDLCTGSGCLAILVARRYRKSVADATDVSTDALAVARINVIRRRLGKRIKLLISNYFSNLQSRRYDLIVSNPPYVRSAVMRTLPREYQNEPALALAAGGDGLDAVRVILAGAARHLNPGGVLVVECGHARERVERAWPRLPFIWPETSGGDDCVFILTREDLRPDALQPQGAMTQSRRQAKAA